MMELSLEILTARPGTMQVVFFSFFPCTCDGNLIPPAPG